MYEEDDLYKSRSQKKRESTAMQGLGEDLARLSPSVLRALGLPEELLKALLDFPKIKTHEGKRRQMQFIGRLMREEIDDPTELIAAVAQATRGRR